MPLSKITIGALCRQGGGNVQTGPFGSQLHAADYVVDGLPSIMPADLIDYRISEANIARISSIDQQRLARYQVQAGDIVYGLRGDIGRHALVKEHENGWLCGTGCLRIRFGTAPVEPQYASYYLRQQPVIEGILAKAVGTTMPNLNTGILESIILELPPLPIQRRIADILGTLDDKIENNRRINATLEAMAQTLFKHWFVDFGPWREGPFVETALGPVPEGWEVKPLPEAVEINPKRTLSKGQIAPYLEMSNMPTTSAQVWEWQDRMLTSGTKFMNGDVLVAKITPCLENGKTAFVDFLTRNQVGWGSTEYIVFRSKPPLSESLMYFLARSTDFRSFAIRQMVGTSGRQRVPDSSFASYLFATPPAHIAKQFGAMVQPMMATMRNLVDEAKALAATRDYLLPRLLSGAIPIAAAEELAEAVALP